MKNKALAWLAGATALMALAAGVVSWQGTPPSIEAGIGEKLLPPLAQQVNDVHTVTIARKGGAFTLARDGERWVAREKNDYPVNFDKVRRLLVDLTELRTLEAKTTVASSYGALEVEDLAAADAKSTLVTLGDAQGRSLASLYVGKQRFGRGGPEGDGVYVRKAIEAQSWLAKPKISVDRDIVQWLDRALIDVSQERIRSIAIAQPDGGRLVISRAKPEDKDFAIESLPEGRKARPAYDINAVAAAFAGVDLDDVRPVGEIKFADGAPQVEAMTFDGLTVRVDLAEEAGKTWARLTASFSQPAEAITPAPDSKPKVAAEVEKEAAQISQRLSAWAYVLPAWKTEQFKKKLDDLLEAKAS